MVAACASRMWNGGDQWAGPPSWLCKVARGKKVCVSPGGAHHPSCTHRNKGTHSYMTFFAKTELDRAVNYCLVKLARAVVPSSRFNSLALTYGLRTISSYDAWQSKPLTCAQPAEPQKRAPVRSSGVIVLPVDPRGYAEWKM